MKYNPGSVISTQQSLNAKMMKTEKIKYNLTSIIKLTGFLSVPSSLPVPALLDHELERGMMTCCQR